MQILNFTGMNQSDHILELARHRRVLRAADVREHGWSPQLMLRLHQAGKLQRVARGLYSLPDAEITEHQTLIEVCQRVPKAVLCLLSALQFHEIGTQLPHEVWIAVDRRTRRPRLQYPPLRVLRFGGAALTEGVERHRLEGREVPVYGIEKTLADCFKYRNKIGLEVALEALREARRERRISLDTLWHFAKVDRVANVMRPYLDAVA